MDDIIYEAALLQSKNSDHHGSHTTQASVDCSTLELREGRAGVTASPPAHPVFIVPGIAGSGLMASAQGASLPFCSPSPVDYPVPFRLWASISLVRPPQSHQLCWLDMMQLNVDATGEKYESKEGLVVEVDSFGGAHGFDYLDYYYNERFGVPGTAYFHETLRTLYANGYQEGQSLVGIPYDWRFPPWQMDFRRLKKEIETHVEAMGGAKADLLVHSLGSLVCNYFLNKVVTQEWKNKYINSYTLVAPATGGSFKAIKAILTGYNDPVDLTFWNFLDISLIPTGILRELARSFGSIYTLLPDINLYGKDHVVIRQLLSKGGGAPLSVALSGAAEEKPSPAAAPGAFRNLELRRLERQPTAEDEEEADSVTAAQRETVREQRVQQETEKMIQQHLRQLERHASESQRKVDVLKGLAGAADVEEIVYTLGNWTVLLDPELRTRANAALQHMEGVLQDPGVPTRCIWSVFAFPSTDISYIYTGNDLSRKPVPVLDVGDDTVPLRSLSVCAGWSSTFEVKTFKNLDHMFIFADGGFNSYIQLAFSSEPSRPHG
ncbi:phospholipid--sterol O-acyltransferase [Cyclospora cayetanensis]|uniref:Phospholipid--sterol O-acyltransferase n=1 Tax=Cyclospora cayetanensis TaxID=88456 RepID=A0A6P6S0L8_9EIME|nr:phospholipid--sterol O-acyltransferase [Cyclospora cayetanensis]